MIRTVARPFTRALNGKTCASALGYLEPVQLEEQHAPELVQFPPTSSAQAVHT